MKHILLAVVCLIGTGCAIARISDDGKSAKIFGLGRFDNGTESIESSIIKMPEIKL